MRRLLLPTLALALALTGVSASAVGTPGAGGDAARAAGARGSTAPNVEAALRRGAATIRLSVDSPMKGERIRVTGNLGTSMKRPVRLQLKHKRKWQTLARGHSKGKRYTFPFRTNEPKSIVRVVAPKAKVDGHKYGAVQSAPLAVRIVAQGAQLTGAVSIDPGQSTEMVAISSPPRRGRQLTLERRSGASFVPVSTAKADTNGRASWNVQPTSGANEYRVTAQPYRGSRKVSSGAWAVAIRAGSSQPAEQPAQPESPPAVQRIDVDRQLVLTVGSGSDLDLGRYLDSIQTLSLSAPQVSGITWRRSTDYTLRVEAAMSAAPDSSTILTATGTGCVGQTCDLPFDVSVSVQVEGLADVTEGEERFTAPSGDRLGALTEQSAGLYALPDEALLTLGTPDAPGTLTRAIELAGLVGASVTGALEDIGVYELRWSAPPSDLEATLQTLRWEPGVAEAVASAMSDVSPEALPPGDWSDDGQAVTWPFTQIRAQQAWDLSKGTGVRVGIIDSGRVYGGHEDLAPVVFAGPDSAVKTGSDCSSAQAVHGNACHATHVAGLACAAANGRGVVGAAWGCAVTSVGLESPYGGPEGSWVTLFKSVLGSARAAAASGVRVANMSLGRNWGSCTSQSESDQINHDMQMYAGQIAFRQLFNGATGRDVLWTLSAGNNCGEGVHSPMGTAWALPNVVTVAASNSDKSLARYSNAGPGVEVAAPGGVGVGIAGAGDGPISTIPKSCGLFGLSTCSDYMPMSGTSMAAPIVAGVAALAIGAAPNRTAAEIGSCIVNSAGAKTGYVRSVSDLPVGFDRQIPMRGALPIVDAEATVKCAQGAQQSAEILVTGEGDRTASGNGTDIGDTVAALIAAGHDVANVRGLPEQLSGYEQIWMIDTEAWTGSEQARVQAFVESGKSVYLTGEWGCCAVDSSTIALINALVPGQSVWHAGSRGVNFAISPDAPFGLGSTPHILNYLQPSFSGSLGGVPEENIIAGEPGGAVFAAWGPNDVTGGGRIAVIMDINWIAEQYRGSNWGDVIENIAAFL